MDIKYQFTCVTFDGIFEVIKIVVGLAAVGLMAMVIGAGF